MVKVMVEEFGGRASDPEGDQLIAEVALARAASLLRLSIVRLGERSRSSQAGAPDSVALFDALTVRSRLTQALAILEGRCQVVPDADLLVEGLAGVGDGGPDDPRVLLAAADAELTLVPTGTRPVHLAAVRAELAGAMWGLTTGSSATTEG